MTALRLNDRQRLDLLAAIVLEYLDETFSEAELDDDSHPPHTELYNVAHAILERHDTGVRGYDRAAEADEQLTAILADARSCDKPGLVSRAADELLEHLGERA